MAKNKSNNVSKGTVEKIVPTGQLLRLTVDQIKTSPSNPRKLFDQTPLEALKDSIQSHGVLVPITVHKVAGQERFAIIDGERRYRACKALADEGLEILVPANVVVAPDKKASLVYMFNIHAFREKWDLMPTALGLDAVMKNVGTEDNTELGLITGLKPAQIRRCKKILSFPTKFQDMSMNPDKSKRIPSNFWVELYDFLELLPNHVPGIVKEHGRDGITQIMLDKYNSGKIKSVTHFRRVLEADEISEEPEEKERLADSIREFILDPDLELREAFDGLIREKKKARRVVRIFDTFISDIGKANLDLTVDDTEIIIDRLKRVIQLVSAILEELQDEEPSLTQ